MDGRLRPSLAVVVAFAFVMASHATAQSTAGTTVCADSGYTLAGCSKPSYGTSSPRGNPALNTYNAIQQNLQRKDQLINDATT